MIRVLSFMSSPSPTSPPVLCLQILEAALVSSKKLTLYSLTDSVLKQKTSNFSLFFLFLFFDSILKPEGISFIIRMWGKGVAAEPSTTGWGNLVYLLGCMFCILLSFFLFSWFFLCISFLAWITSSGMRTQVHGITSHALWSRLEHDAQVLFFNVICISCCCGFSSWLDSSQRVGYSLSWDFQNVFFQHTIAFSSY